MNSDGEDTTGEIGFPLNKVRITVGDKSGLIIDWNKHRGRLNEYTIKFDDDTTAQLKLKEVKWTLQDIISEGGGKRKTRKIKE